MLYKLDNKYCDINEVVGQNSIHSKTDIDRGGLTPVVVFCNGNSLFELLQTVSYQKIQDTDAQTTTIMEIHKHSCNPCLTTAGHCYKFSELNNRTHVPRNHKTRHLTKQTIGGVLEVSVSWSKNKKDPCTETLVKGSRLEAVVRSRL